MFFSVKLMQVIVYLFQVMSVNCCFLVRSMTIFSLIIDSPLLCYVDKRQSIVIFNQPIVIFCQISTSIIVILCQFMDGIQLLFSVKLRQLI